MTCRHEHPMGLTWDDGIGWMTCGDDARICRRCRKWLSLGASNDDGCAVEIRAVEIAAAPVDDDIMSASEFVGWCHGNPLAAHIALDGSPSTVSEYNAGYLARQIAEHGEQA